MDLNGLQMDLTNRVRVNRWNRSLSNGQIQSGNEIITVISTRFKVRYIKSSFQPVCTSALLHFVRKTVLGTEPFTSDEHEHVQSAKGRPLLYLSPLREKGDRFYVRTSSNPITGSKSILPRNPLAPYRYSSIATSSSFMVSHRQPSSVPRNW
jgi:hypothetical protein